MSKQPSVEDLEHLFRSEFKASRVIATMMANAVLGLFRAQDSMTVTYTQDLGNGQSYTVTIPPDPFSALRVLATWCYENSRVHGFHDDVGTVVEALTSAEDPLYAQALDIVTRDRLGNRLMLIAGEVTEAHEELRSGHAPTETYYRADGKPEGIPSELADVIIRVFDFAAENGIDIGAAVEEKMKFNASRPYKHNREF